MNTLTLTIVMVGGWFHVVTPTLKPYEVYTLHSSTNLAAGWDDTDAQTFYLRGNWAVTYSELPNKPVEFFMLEDTGQAVTP